MRSENEVAKEVTKFRFLAFGHGTIYTVGTRCQLSQLLSRKFDGLVE